MRDINDEAVFLRGFLKTGDSFVDDIGADAVTGIGGDMVGFHGGRVVPSASAPLAVGGAIGVRAVGDNREKFFY